LPFLVLGVGILWSGVNALGVAKTLFVYEYIAASKPVTTDGIFRFLRHPLFLGGSLLSLGLAICTNSQLAVELGAINACVIPIYVRLEDRRCCNTLGQEYMDYRAAVGGVIPRRRSAINLSALEHHPSGSIGPTTPRDLATTR
jgi:protein-S-isoprenylcysteine O-methyltransferase Ste14